MGFSSYHCVGCGAPLVSHWGFEEYKRLPEKVKFLQRAVRVFEDGRTIRGEYTGYSGMKVVESYDGEFDGLEVVDDICHAQKLPFNSGVVEVTVDGKKYAVQRHMLGELVRVHLIDLEQEPCMYHEECWENLGRPTEYIPSARAECQGYWFNSTELAKAKPVRG